VLRGLSGEMTGELEWEKCGYGGAFVAVPPFGLDFRVGDDTYDGLHGFGGVDNQGADREPPTDESPRLLGGHSTITGG
jgi:hypothetical protein